MKAKLILLLLASYLWMPLAGAQSLYGTSTGQVKIYSDTPLETIEALNQKVGALINLESGNLAVQMKITDFNFPNKLMQEHFNENYMESEKYPMANFKGKITPKIDPAQSGTVTLKALGTMTIHGVSRPASIEGKATLGKNTVELEFRFMVKPEQYKVEIPSLVITKIAEDIEVSGKLYLIERSAL